MLHTTRPNSSHSNSSSSSSSNNGSQRRRRQLMLQLLLPLLLLGWCRFCCSASKSSEHHDSRALVYLQGMHKLCGQELNNALEAVCYGIGYNTMGKRRTDDHNSDANALTESSHPGYKLSPVLSNIYGTEVLIKSRRLRRQNGGIHDECCLKACSYYELRAYCRPE